MTLIPRESGPGITERVQVCTTSQQNLHHRDGLPSRAGSLAGRTSWAKLPSSALSTSHGVQRLGTLSTHGYTLTVVHPSPYGSAQMITTALNVGSDGAINLGAGPTFGILIAILFTHAMVCSAATAVLARLNIFFVIVNGRPALFTSRFWLRVSVGSDSDGRTRGQSEPPSPLSSRCSYVAATSGCRPRPRSRCSRTAVAGQTVRCPLLSVPPPEFRMTGCISGGWAFLLAFTSPMWTLTGCTSLSHPCLPLPRSTH